MQITVDIPDEIAAELVSNPEGLKRRLLEDSAVGAYCRNAITRQELRHFLGFSTGHELDGYLKGRGVDHGAYDGASLLEDLATLDAMSAEQQQA